MKHGDLKCWGSNLNGQLGVGDRFTRSASSSLSAIDLGLSSSSVVSYEMGEWHACAVLDGGILKCWGFNDRGQLGLNDKARRGDDPNEMGDRLPVVNVGLGRSVVMVATGKKHTCALLDDASVKCWGRNDISQLGNGDCAETMIPQLVVDFGLGRTAVSVSSGGHGNCAILDNNSIKCWGRNDWGQLGLGWTDAWCVWTNGAGNGLGDYLPSVNLGTNRHTVSMTTSISGSCAILDNNQVKCWGTNNNGQLGIGSTILNIGISASQMGDNLQAVDFGTSSGSPRTAVMVNSYFNHVCAVLNDGEVKCWGRNQEYECGVSSGPNDIGKLSSDMGNNLQAVNLGAGLTAVSADAGSVQSCVELNTGDVKCWGNTVRGGPGDAMGDTLPVIALGFVAPPTTTPTSTTPTSSPTSRNPTSTTNPTSSSPSSKNPTSTPTSSSPTSTSPTSQTPTSSPTLNPFSSNPTSTPTSLNPTSLNPTSLNPTSLNPASLNPTSLNPTSSTPTSSSPTSTSPTSLTPTSSPTLNPTSSNPTSTPASSTPTSLNPTSLNPTSLNPASLNPASSNPTSTTPSLNYVGATSNPTVSPTITRNPTTSPTIPSVYVRALVQPVVGMCEPVTVGVAVRDTGVPGGGTPGGHNPVISWNYSTSQPNSPEIRAQLSQDTGANLTWSSIQADALFPPGVHEFQASYLANSSGVFMASMVFTKTGNKPPTFSLDVVDTKISAFVHKPFSVVATAIRNPCLTQTDAVTSAVWRLVGGNYQNASAVSASSDTLSFASGTLEMGVTYMFNLSGVTVDGHGNVLGRANHTESIFIMTVVTPVVAMIAGAANRTISTNGSYSFTISSMGTKDSSASALLVLVWNITCVSGCTQNTVTPKVISNGRIRLNNTQFEPDQVYEVKLLAVGHSATGVPPRNATATMMLTTLGASVPSVAIIVAGSNQDMLRMPTRNRLVMTASVANFEQNENTFNWTCTTLNLNLGDSTHTTTSTSGPSMVLQRGALGSGVTHTFQVDVTHVASGLVGTAELTVRGLVPPWGGICSSIPSTGSSFSTVFALSCTNWTAVNTPIYYAFSTLLTASADTLPLRICVLSPKSTCNTTLPIAVNPSITIQVDVTDFLGETTTSSFAVGLTSTGASTTSLVADVKDAAANGDIRKLSLLVAGTAALLELNTNTSANERASVRESLLTAVLDGRENSVRLTKQESVITPLSLVSTVISTTGNMLEEVTLTTRKIGLTLLSSITADPLNDFSDDVINATLRGIDKILISRPLQIAANDTSDNSVVFLMNDLGAGIAGGLVPGEVVRVYSSETGSISVQQRNINAESVTVTSGRVTFTIESLSSQDLGVAVAANDDEEGPDTVGIIASAFVIVGVNRIFDRFDGNSSDIGTLSLVHGNSVLNVSNLTKPVNISFSREDQADIGASRNCQFRDYKNNVWSTAGMTTAEWDGTTAKCQARTLATYVTDFRLGVNTFDSSDVVAAFSLKNPFLVMIGIIIMVFVVIAFVAYHFDSKLRDKVDDSTDDDFWRTLNGMRRMRLAGSKKRRTLMNFQQISIWSLRRRHPWASIFLRHPSDFVTSLKRVAILATLIFCSMTVCALLADQDQRILGLPRNVSVGLFAIMLSFPLPLTISFIFKRRVPPHMMLAVDDIVDTLNCLGWGLLLLGVFFGELELEDIGGTESNSGEGEGGGDLEGGDDEIEASEQGAEGKGDSEGDDSEDVTSSESESEVSAFDEKRGNVAYFALGGAVMGATVGRVDSKTGPVKKKRHQRKAQNKTQKTKKDESKRVQQSPDPASCEISSVGSEPGGPVHPMSPGFKKSFGVSPEFSLTRSEPQLGFGVGARSPIRNSLGEGKNENFGFVPSSDETAPNAPIIARRKENFHFGPQELRKSNRAKKRTAKPTRPPRERGMYGGRESVGHTSNMRFTVNKRTIKCMKHDVSTQHTTRRDMLGFLVSVLFVFGCAFVVIVLSFKLQNEYSNFLASTVLAFLQDISLRCLQILVVEALFFVPWCFICCFFCSASNHVQHNKKHVVATLPVGYVGFHFFNLKVTEVDGQSPALNAGVKAGMHVLLVDGEAVSDDKDLLHKLDVIHKSQGNFEIVFHKIEQSIGGLRNMSIQLPA